MEKRPLATLQVKGKMEDGLKNSIHVRDLPPFTVDEPERLGGTNAGPNPLEYFLGALSACTSIMAAYVAKDMDFNYTDFTYESSGTLDPRGFKGVEGVQTYFQTVQLDVVIETEETEARLEQFRETVESRCPLYNLLKDAGVEVTGRWSKR
ncbi:MULTISPECIES: OsmC family protein [Sporosarcina]|uniref:OsmC family protein n=1 Tax=Sporosarcina TaxID=1569 RepID=UPI00058C42B3|nr:MULTISPECIES: OsmC family protein [Sporosarcina]WJY26359.1 OsmC family protein [Sporosarcina sp. 0.2-SM1T-5]